MKNGTQKALGITWCLAIVMALAVVSASHQCRQLYTQLSELQHEANRMQVVWGQYLLEQSSLASLTKIEAEAMNNLDMVVPNINHVVMVQP